MKTRACLLSAVAWVSILTCSSSRAAVLFDSTTTPADNYAYIAGAGSVDNEEWMAQSFTVGASSATLTSVVLSMTNVPSDPVNASGNFFVGLYDATGAGSIPGTSSLLTLSGSANPSTAGDYTYTGSYLLAANTTYYIVAGVSSGNSVYEWAAHSSQDPATIGYSDSFNGGVTWNSDNTPPGTVFTDSTFNMQINGDVTPVPEPSVWGLVCVAGLAFIVARRRQSLMARQK